MLPGDEAHKVVVISTINAKKQAISGAAEKYSPCSRKPLCGPVRNQGKPGPGCAAWKNVSTFQALSADGVEAVCLFRVKGDARAKPDHFFFSFAFFFGLVLPCELRKIFPFLVFLSPLPMGSLPPSSCAFNLKPDALPAVYLNY